mmetsp:Transcript_9181/g.19902  ORF Transcript_9181/g.19902 Transcript_9181/m.19902 type:complete len:100 (-) Transcript_9181:234-533(-)
MAMLRDHRACSAIHSESVICDAEYDYTRRIAPSTRAAIDSFWQVGMITIAASLCGWAVDISNVRACESCDDEIFVILDDSLMAIVTSMDPGQDIFLFLD